jgi:2-succinyl-6-hydroxy-2,4-cyclohexadiene-1-carboxylate synthase
MTVILLHGFTHTGRSWEPVIAGLAGRYRALAPDIRGHGSAARAEPVTLEAVIADIHALATDAAPAGLDELTLVGYSMGGRIALHAALALRERVGRLILIGASPGLADPAARAERREADERLADEIESMTIEEFAERWARTPVLADQPVSVRDRVTRDRLRNTPAGLARALRGLGTGALPSLWERLPELMMPITLIVGERDEKFRAIASQMARELPDPEILVVVDAGHAVHLEAPGPIRSAIGGER